MANTQLLLQEARTVLTETGWSRHHDAGEPHGLRRALAQGRLVAEGLYHDEVAGCLLASPSPDLDDTTDGDWRPVGAHWCPLAAQPSPFWRADGSSALAMAWRDQGAWSLESLAHAGWGEPRYVRWITYQTPGAPADQGLTLTFGGVWRLRLRGDGQAELARARASGTGWDELARFAWMRTPQYAPAAHWLWVYEVGPKLVVRGLDPNTGEPGLGLAWLDETAQADPARPARGPHALRAGVWTISGEGFVTLGAGRQRFVPGVVSLTQPAAEPVGAGGIGSTQPLAAHVYGLASDPAIVPLVEAWDEQDQPWPLAPAPAFTPARSALRWRVSWTATADATWYLTALHLALGPVGGSNGATGTDVLAVAGVADRALTLACGELPSAERLDVALLADHTPLAGWVQPNMSVRLVSDGVTRFRGLTTSARWDTLADTTPVTGTLTLAARGLWQRFVQARWPGGQPFDGRRLVDCLAEALGAAGLTSADWVLVSDPLVVPAAPDGCAPAFRYRAGTTVARVLDDLRAKLGGVWLTMAVRRGDGRFVVGRAQTGASVASFYQDSATAGAAGVGDQVILAGSYREVLDQRQMANVVTVVGQAPDGRALSAQAVDHDSITDPSVWNYVGAVWTKTVRDPGLATQAAVNLACRSLFDRHRDPRVFARWESVWLDLEPGEVVTLVGANHGQEFVLRAVHADVRAGRAWYSGEAVR